MWYKILLLSLQVLAASASPNFSDALKFHEKRQTPQQALSACSLVLDVLSQCGNATPGFVTMAASAQASCACYNAGATTTAWRPNAFDGAVETCASYASKNDVNVYRGLQPFINLCNKVGDLRTVKGPPPPAACTNLIGAINYCNTEIPGLSTMGVSMSARCLCYDKTTWLPNNFDGWVSTCEIYAKTASPSDYPVLQKLDGFCHSVGDVLQPANTPASTTTQPPISIPPSKSDPITKAPSITTPPSTPTLSLTGYITFPACAIAGSAIASCELASPGFTSAPIETQAACICYTRKTSWVPERFDSPISSCGDFVQTAEPDAYSIYTGLAGFCSSVGDIYATDAAATTTNTRIASGGGGLDANGIMGALTRTAARSSTSTSPSATVPNPEPATTSSRAGVAPTGVVGEWALRMISVVVVVQVFA